MKKNVSPHGKEINRSQNGGHIFFYCTEISDIGLQNVLQICPVETCLLRGRACFGIPIFGVTTLATGPGLTAKYVLELPTR